MLTLPASTATVKLPTTNGCAERIYSHAFAHRVRHPHSGTDDAQRRADGGNVRTDGRAHGDGSAYPCTEHCTHEGS